MATWASFCQLLHDRFDRDQHESLLRQIFNIRQTSTVSTYVTAFSELVDQLKSYSPNSDPLFFTTRFIDGLRQDIKSVIMVLQPQSFDAAVRLALLQEEAAPAQGHRTTRGGDWPQVPRPRLPASATPLPLPPPPRGEKPAAPGAPAMATVATTTAL